MIGINLTVCPAYQAILVSGHFCADPFSYPVESTTDVHAPRAPLHIIETVQTRQEELRNITDLLRFSCSSTSS